MRTITITVTEAEFRDIQSALFFLAKRNVWSTNTTPVVCRPGIARSPTGFLSFTVA